MDRNCQNIVLVNISWTARPTPILMLFFSSLDNLVYDEYTIFQKGVGHFETEHKTC